MSEKRVTVWVQRFKGRSNLMLQWLDPDTHKRKSQSAKTNDEAEAEKARADLEYELNHGLHKQASRMSWSRFRQTFEEEGLSNLRPMTRRGVTRVLDLLEQICKPPTIRSVTARTVSVFVAGLRKLHSRGRDGLQSSTIRTKLGYLHGVLGWAVSQSMLPAVPEFPAVKVPKKTPQPVAAETFERLLLKADDPFLRVLLLSGWLAGLRLAEAVEL
ncbi:MAG TPA: hypothetical protein VIK18_22905, partial [Pirellulales bacterium]